MQPPPFLELKGISKAYPGVIALNDVSLDVCAGEVIGLVGENGAGKSTLMKVLGGIVAPSSGSILIDGGERSAMTVAASMEAGIAFVHQELNLFDNLDAAGNIFVGREPRRGALRLLDRAGMRAAAAPLLDRIGADFGPDTPVLRLSLAQRQLLEIAKALSLDSRLVIMDEPTSSLTLSETDRLLRVVADLKAHGVSTIFISHRLNEVQTCVDRVVVLRDGRVVARLDRHEITPEAMIRQMIGRDLKALYKRPAAEPGEPILELRGLRTTAWPDGGVDLAVRRGEILGLAGRIGAGRSEAARVVFGIDRGLGGTIWLDGAEVSIAAPRDAVARGIYLVPEDRKRSGVILDLAIAGNIALAQLPALAWRGLVSDAAETALAEKQRRRLDIRAPSVAAKVVSLSGGNQQKVVLAKWLSMRPRAIIFDEPTRGVDVGAKSEIYEIMRGLADAGVGILMISSDMEEVIGVGDRIAVMHEGRISGMLERPDFSEHAILHLAVGNRAN